MDNQPTNNPSDDRRSKRTMLQRLKALFSGEGSASTPAEPPTPPVAEPPTPPVLGWVDYNLLADRLNEGRPDSEFREPTEDEIAAEIERLQSHPAGPVDQPTDDSPSEPRADYSWFYDRARRSRLNAESRGPSSEEIKAEIERLRDHQEGPTDQSPAAEVTERPRTAREVIGELSEEVAAAAHEPGARPDEPVDEVNLEDVPLEERGWFLENYLPSPDASRWHGAVDEDEKGETGTWSWAPRIPGQPVNDPVEGKVGEWTLGEPAEATAAESPAGESPADDGPSDGPEEEGPAAAPASEPDPTTGPDSSGPGEAAAVPEPSPEGPASTVGDEEPGEIAQPGEQDGPGDDAVESDSLIDVLFVPEVPVRFEWIGFDVVSGKLDPDAVVELRRELDTERFRERLSDLASPARTMPEADMRVLPTPEREITEEPSDTPAEEPASPVSDDAPTQELEVIVDLFGGTVEQSPGAMKMLPEDDDSFEVAPIDDGPRTPEPGDFPPPGGDERW